MIPSNAILLKNGSLNQSADHVARNTFAAGALPIFQCLGDLSSKSL